MQLAVDYLDNDNEELNMFKIKIRWCELFVGIVLLLGGVICILIPATKLESRFLVTIILGITLVMLGGAFIWKTTVNLKGHSKFKGSYTVSDKQ